VKEVAEGTEQRGHQAQRVERRGGRGGRGRGERGGRRYNDESGDNQNNGKQQRGGDDQTKMTQQIVYRKVKKTDGGHDNADGRKEQPSSQA